MSEPKRIYAYSWHLDEEITDVTIVRCYGLDAQNKNVCLTITGFNPYMYLELPERNLRGNPIHWDTHAVAALGQALNKLVKPEHQPVRKVSCTRKRLYGAHLNADGSPKFFPYVQCFFNSKKDLRMFGYKCKYPLEVLEIGKVQLKLHDTDATEILQLTSNRNIPTAGWIEVDEARTLRNGGSKCDYDLSANWKNLSPSSDQPAIPNPLIMGFDIEVYSSNPNAMPDALKPADEIFQISCVFWREGDPIQALRKILLTLTDPAQTVEVAETGPTGTAEDADYQVETFATESALLRGFTDLINETNPNIISGYNIMCFDIPYMIDRAKTTYCFEFFEMGFTTKTSKEKKVKWSSSAYKNQEFKFLDTEGRIFIDLLPLVKRDYKMDNYRLKTISNYFLGKSKDPLSVKGIFRCYDMGIQNLRYLQDVDPSSYTERDRKGIAKGRRLMQICGKYCVQDSVLVVELMERLNTWNGLTQMASVCNVPIMAIFTQGQQIKVFSQIYKYCIQERIVVEKDGYKATETDRYMGALVHDPDPGQYEMVAPLDFSSLYPSCIMAYNICYSTWVTDPAIPDELCHVMKWGEHVYCTHDPKFQRLTELTTYIDLQQDKLKKLREKKKASKSKKLTEELSRDIEEILIQVAPYRSERSELQKQRPRTVTCCERHFRFLREPKGVVPTVIQNLIDARKHTRKVEMSAVHAEIARLETNLDLSNQAKTQQLGALKTKLAVLDKKQLAYKISSNSMYGSLGVREGYLPFMPGAMATTFMGRETITAAIQAIRSRYKCHFVYSDTDSTYLSLAELVREGYTQGEIWDYAQRMADEVSQLFPKPIKLEFEQVLYPFFCILTKKKYIYRSITSRDGEVSHKAGSKGVLTARRDNSLFVRKLYEELVGLIADKTQHTEVEYWLIQQLNRLFSRSCPITDFVITKAINETDSFQAEAGVNEKGEARTLIGDYSVKPLPTNEKARREFLENNGFSTEREYYISCLPAHVQLAQKIRERGERVDVGTRLEYVVLHPEMQGTKWKLADKVEALEYFQRHREVLQIDPFYYSKALVNPVDQLLNAAFKGKCDWDQGFMEQQHKYRLKVREPLMNAIRRISQPKLVLT